MKDVPKLICSILICQTAGVAGSFFTAKSASTWYGTLNRPGFTPPDWLFSPVWITLFALMGISLYLVWIKGAGKNKAALAMFGVQLFLNILWSAMFFGLQSPLLAFVEIIALWAAILVTIAWFYRISRPAAYFLVPYVIWVSFAAVLNFSIFYLNS
ncbi:MAG: TspO/MBR family protein [Candidatus Woesearchaeota archaeon]